MPLTDTSIRNAKPKYKQYKRTDGGGLYLLVSPKDGKWWRFDYRLNGKRKTLSMGVYPDISLKDARDSRDEARKLVAKGVDPCEVRKAARIAQSDEDSFEAVAREWWSKREPNWSKTHSSRILLRLNKVEFPQYPSQIKQYLI
ncbi:MAG: Arm DNA-binding domain-containing protein [Candidatus Thiodiazotropha sp.]